MHFQDAEAQLRLAEKLRQSARYDEAVSCLHALLCADPGLAAAHNNLGLIWIGKHDYAQAIVCFREAIRIRRDFAEAFCNFGLLLLVSGDCDGAEAAIGEALRIKPDCAPAHLNRAAIWLRKGDFERGLPEFEWRRLCDAHRMAPVAAALWDGTLAPGSVILLRAEQGIGDNLQFVRFAPQVKERCGTVALQCDRSLLPLLKCCPGIDQFVARGERPPKCHFQAPLMSLPLMLRTTLASIPAEVPYVFADSDLVHAWEKRLAAHQGFKVGIGWQGNPSYPTDDLRSIPLRHFAPLVRVPGVTIVSLQKGKGSEQLDGVTAEWGVVAFGAELDTVAGTFMDTAAIMRTLDLVITSDTATAHLAGSLGVPVWVALCQLADWRWLEEREDSPWYPTMRLFRQNQFNAWEPVFERMAVELAALVRGDRSRLVPSATRLVGPVLAPISAGELIDKLSILEIKSEQIQDAAKVRRVREELEELRRIRAHRVPQSDELHGLAVQLKAVNQRLWDIENSLRTCEIQRDFGPRFTELAREVYMTNDRRAGLKREIDRLLGSWPIEEKAYQ
jgi:hypothetical protein